MVEWAIAPGSPEEVPGEEHGGEEGHGEGDEAQGGDGGVLLPLEEEIELEGVDEHPSAAEVAADEGLDDIHDRMMALYRQMLQGAEDAEVRGEFEHAEWLRQQAEELQW